MKTVWLKPTADDLVVRDPVTKEKLPADGAEKTLDTYWRRRINDGDAIETSKPRKSSAKSDAKENGE